MFSMNKYKCTKCNFIYDPKQGDPAFGVPPGTPFEMDYIWCCFRCGNSKDKFEKLEEDNNLNNETTEK